MFDMYVIAFVSHFCLKSGSSDWMACMCAVDWICYCDCCSLLFGGKTEFEIARSLVLSHRLLTLWISLVC